MLAPPQDEADRGLGLRHADSYASKSTLIPSSILPRLGRRSPIGSLQQNQTREVCHAESTTDISRRRGGTLRNAGIGADVDIPDRSRLLLAILHYRAREGSDARGAPADAAPSSQPPRQSVPHPQRRSVGGGGRGRDHLHGARPGAESAQE